MQSKAVRTLKPLLSALAIVLILKWTGALSGISYLTTSAIMQTGIMNASADTSLALKDKEFDYNFSVFDLEGNTIDFKTFKGKTIFLNLWATWCGPCRVEMPSIQELYTKVDTSKVVFVMLSIDVRENSSKISKFVEEKKYTFPVYRAGDYLPEVLQVNTIPTTFVVSADGKILSKKVGAANYDTTKFLKFLQGEK